MASVDELGEKALGLLERLYVFILDVLIRLAKTLQGLTARLEEFDRDQIYPYFEKREIDPRDYTIFKLEMSAALFLIASMLFVFNFLGGNWYAFLGLLLLLSSLRILLGSVKKEFEDFIAYRDFFLSYLSLALLLALIKLYRPMIDHALPFLHFVVVAVLGVIVISTSFRKKYSRNYTFGTVLADGVDIKVKFNYDLRSDIKPQVAVFRNTLNARKGDRVKVRVKKGFLSIRGSTPMEVLGVEWG